MHKIRRTERQYRRLWLKNIKKQQAAGWTFIPQKQKERRRKERDHTDPSSVEE